MGTTCGSGNERCGAADGRVLPSSPTRSGKQYLTSWVAICEDAPRVLGRVIALPGSEDDKKLNRAGRECSLT